MNDEMFFRDVSGMIRTLAGGVLAYVAVVALLRISGRRTLSKMNAFDFVVTIALGSTLATLLLDRGVPLAEGVLALALLIGLQFAVTWSSVRAGLVKRIVTGEPILLLHQGTYLQSAMRRARVTEEEVRAGVRKAGLGSLAGIDAVVLETDGSFSVVRRGQRGEPSTLDEFEPPVRHRTQDERDTR